MGNKCEHYDINRVILNEEDYKKLLNGEVVSRKFDDQTFEIILSDIGIGRIKKITLEKFKDFIIKNWSG